MTHLQFQLGGIGIDLDAPLLDDHTLIPESYLPFISSQSPQIFLKHHLGRMPDLVGWNLSFDSGGIWKLYSRSNFRAITVQYANAGDQFFHFATLSEDYHKGEVVTNQDLFDPSQPGRLFYPWMELIVANLLGQGCGLLIHACAVKIGNLGLLFAGNSGSGKSTLTNLWSSHADVTLLSDDRVILRKQDDGFWIYGTPWHGDACAISPGSVPLTHVFFLKHASENAVTSLRPLQMAAHLFTRSFPPYWNIPGMEYSLELLSGVSQAVPGYEFGFTPDQRAIDFIRTFPGLLS